MTGPVAPRSASYRPRWPPQTVQATTCVATVGALLVGLMRGAGTSAGGVIVRVDNELLRGAS